MAGQTSTPDNGLSGRLLSLMSDHGVDNIHAFAVDIGLGDHCARVYSWARGHTLPGYHSLRAILTRYPDVDARWLLGCEGADDE